MGPARTTELLYRAGAKLNLLPELEGCGPRTYALDNVRAESKRRLMSKSERLKHLERVQRNQGVAILVLLCTGWFLLAALFRKGVLSPKDLLADA
jgi:hypothetical protein